VTNHRILEIDQYADPHTGELTTHFGGYGELWIPPTVTISAKGDDWVVYPVPDLRVPIGRLTAFQFWNTFKDAGWRERDTGGAFPDNQELLMRFINLADAPTESIRRFASVWGPLYWCQTHRDYCWKPAQIIEKNECRWLGREPVNVLRQVAGELGAAFRIAASLTEGTPVPADAWRMIPGCDLFESQKPVSDQKMWLTQIINENLRKRGVGWSFVWKENRTEPELSVDSGFGFIGIAWFQVAQLLTGSRGIYVCSGCAKPYVRRSKRPKSSTRNYCPDCGSKAAKRDWIREKRATASS